YEIKECDWSSDVCSSDLHLCEADRYALLAVEKRIPIGLTQMPDHLRKAFIAIEDVRFYQHSGFDIRGMLRASYKNVLRGSMSEGASTITQQLARNLFLSPTKTMKRKMEELILAVNIERSYSKDEILNMYLNLIYLGEGAYGVESASHTFFDKSAKDLTLAESATLAAMVKAPSRSSPFKNLSKTLDRRNLVLKKMLEARFISQHEYENAVKSALVLAPFKIHEKRTGFFIEYTKQQIEDYVPTRDEIMTSGLTAHTTINLKMTQYGYEAIDKGMKLYQQRNPKAQNPPEVALIAMEVKTGELKVLIGGRDFTTSPYNRATQAKRQPGSAFKPIIYLAALEAGYRPDSIVKDAPVSYTSPGSAKTWQPKNYDNQYYGDVPLRTALAMSLNTATVRLLDGVGVSNVIELAKRLHMTSNFQPNLALALGAAEVSPLELAAAYATIAQGGNYVAPITLKGLIAADGSDLFGHKSSEEQRVISSEAASMLINMMKGVIKNGTARRASSMPYFLAGKTGTTDDYRDAWFVGFSPDLLCLVWVGYDKGAFLGKKESGATTALPIWMEFMSKALVHYPNEDFSFPQSDSLPVVKYTFPSLEQKDNR
ncbi:MAG TPA: penicillin-binding protein 1A, partial [Deltaproteobacteria bacterium]|nr:penicillin-binding protein 1A [Deltaproteobacteria bacterium]